MNENNQISAETKLFGFIAEKAQSNRFSVTLNQTFKAQGDDAMMIPMNIREDDLYFTVSNLRRSQLKGAAVGVEYQKAVVEILDHPSEMVALCGFCDTITVKEGQLYGEIRSADAVVRLLQELGATRVAVIGGGALAKALARSNGDVQWHFYHEYVEALLEMSQIIGKDVDMNRLADGMAVNMGDYDAVVDACRMEHLNMISMLPKWGIDLRESSVASPLRVRCQELGANYQGYEALLPYLTQSAYDFWMKEEQ